MKQTLTSTALPRRHFLPTGEYRPPRKGEWFFSPMRAEPTEARLDFASDSPCIILREVDPPGVFPPWLGGGGKESGSPYNTGGQGGWPGLYAFRTSDNSIAIEPTYGPSSILIREEAIRFARDILRHYGEGLA